MQKQLTTPAIQVVVVEDNIADFELIKIACANLLLPVKLIHFFNGLQLFKHLDRCQTDISFFLIDLKNPIMNGTELIRQLKTRPSIREIPFIVFTTSDDRRDILSCKASGANGFVQKPIDYDEFEACLSSIFEFWGRYNLM